MPWYLKLAMSLGGAGLVWKAIQGGVPWLLGALTPLALKGADATVALLLSNSFARWLLLGDLKTTHATINALLDGLEGVLNAVQDRVNADLDAAAAPPPPAPEPPAKP